MSHANRCAFSTTTWPGCLAAILGAVLAFPGLQLRAQCAVTLGEEFHASDPATFTNFGGSVALRGTRALIGAFNAEVAGKDNAGAVYVLDFDGQAWHESFKLVETNGTVDALFGRAVALGGQRAVIGAAGAQAPQIAAIRPGAAYVYTWDGAAWQQEDILHACCSADLQDSNFGAAVAISPDGTSILVGAPTLFAPLDIASAGPVHSYRYVDHAWQSTGIVKPAGYTFGGRFGTSIAMWGRFALIGAPLVDGAAKDTGAAWIFELVDTGWVERAKLTASDAQKNDVFGSAVALSGNRALIGSPSTSSFLGRPVCVFEFDGSTWQQTATLLPPEGAHPQRFGNSVALSGDRAVVGSTGDEDGAKAYHFTFDGSAWSPATVISVPSHAGGAGTALSLSGNRLLIGLGDDDDFGYGSGSAIMAATCAGWSDLGGGQPGADGGPQLSGDGTLQAGDLATITLSGAAPMARGVLVLGLGLPVELPFHGGILQVDPAQFPVVPFRSDVHGAFRLQAVMPGGLSGQSLLLQATVLDPAASGTHPLSNALAAYVP